jgi:hypothetical protein
VTITSSLLETEFRGECVTNLKERSSSWRDFSSRDARLCRSTPRGRNMFTCLLQPEKGVEVQRGKEISWTFSKEPTETEIWRSAVIDVHVIGNLLVRKYYCCTRLLRYGAPICSESYAVSCFTSCRWQSLVPLKENLLCRWCMFITFQGSTNSILYEGARIMKVFHCELSPCKFLDSTSNETTTATAKTFPVLYSLIILPFDAVKSELLGASLNNPQVNK